MKTDDPKLSAYAFGELDGAERATVEKQVSESDELRLEVEAIRQTGELLSAGLATEPAAALSDTQRGRIKAVWNKQPLVSRNAPSVRRIRWRIWIPAALAASILLAATALSIFLPTLSRARELSKRLVVSSDVKSMGTSAKLYVGAYEWDRSAFLTSTNYGLTPLGSSLDLYFPTNELNYGFQGLGEVPGPESPAESYDHIVENAFLRVLDSPLSTFSIDVDTASYANVRRMLTQGVWPPAGAVRIEEMVNYFDYEYPPPTGADPFSVNVGIAECPWNPEHRLARVGLKGMEFTPEQRPPANLVFLIDVSGSMQPENKLPLLKEAMKLLVSELNDDDSVAMVVYAGASGVVLEPTWASNRKAITDALDRLQAGGSTNGGAGISLAYDLALKGFVEGGVNRVILATDGDFNVGLTSQSDLVSLIEDRAKAGVFLSVLGFGMGNYKDSTLEKLADKGNGNYAYIDTEREARKVLVEQIGGTLVTIAKDVKVQIEFNPAVVAAYRLIGYENRLLAAQDFNDDAKDAGEIGAGHTVTAFYELIPTGGELPADLPTVDPLKYQAVPAVGVDAAAHAAVTAESGEDGPAALTPAALSDEMMTVKLRYKAPDGDVSKLIEVPVRDTGSTLAQASDDFIFAASVASFGMLLRGGAPANPVDAAHTPAGASPASATRPLPDITLAEIRELAASTLGRDPNGYRTEFVGLVRRAEELRGR